MVGCGGVETATIWETLDMQLEKLNEGEFINVSEESDWDGKDGNAPEKVMPPKTLHQTNSWRYFIELKAYNLKLSQT